MVLFYLLTWNVCDIDGGGGGGEEGRYEQVASSSGIANLTRTYVHTYVFREREPGSETRFRFEGVRRLARVGRGEPEGVRYFRGQE